MGLEGAALAGLGKAFLIPPPRPPSTHAAPGGAGARSSPPRGTPSTTDEGSNPVKVAGPRLAQFLQLVSKSRCLAGAPEPSLPLGRARDKVGFVPSDQSGGARPCHLPRRPVDGQRPRAPRPPPLRRLLLPPNLQVTPRLEARVPAFLAQRPLQRRG